MVKKEENKPIYKRKKEPFYGLSWENVKGICIMVAEEIGEDGWGGWNGDIQGRFPVIEYTHLETNKLKGEFFDSAFQYETRQLDKLIARVEKAWGFYSKTDPFVNAYRLVYFKIKQNDKDQIEVLIELYHVEIDNRVDFKAYRRLCDRVKGL